MQYVIEFSSLGDNLRALRKQKGWTQADLVAKLQLKGSGMSVQTYSKIETGVRNIKQSDLVILKHVLDVNYAQILEKPEGG